MFVEVIVPAQLNPFDAAPVLESLGNSGRLLTVEEGSVSLGWGSEVVSQTMERWRGKRGFTARRLGARDMPIPTSKPLEDAVLPSVQDIYDAALALMTSVGSKE